jgi:hypothetical protein
MKPKKNRLTRSNVRDVVVLCAFGSSLLYGAGLTTEIIGFCLLGIGCFLHIVAKGQLIRNVVLCNKGIYGIVRHPYYLANYLIDSSFCVLSGNLYLIAAYPFLFFWAYGPTLRKEESFLASKYGNSFENDSFTIPQLFPDRDSLTRWRDLFEGFSIKRISLKERARITRFCACGFAIMLLHAVDLHQLQYLFHPTRTNYEAFAFMLLATAFLFVSIIFILIDRSHGSEREDACE